MRFARILINPLGTDPVDGKAFSGLRQPPKERGRKAIISIAVSWTIFRRTFGLGQTAANLMPILKLPRRMPIN